MQLPRLRLDDLLGGLAEGEVPDCELRDLALDSRQIVAGALFLACAGRSTHGLQFADQAIACGAVAIAYEPVEGLQLPRTDVPLIPVPHLSRLIGRLAHRFFGAPSASLAVTGVTGTNGKTTTAHMIAAALGDTGVRCGFVGTIGAGFPGGLDESSLTTPDAVSVHRLLTQFADQGAEGVAMEVSSHALDQGRVSAVRFRHAVFTNLSRDHLDYHGSYEAYARAKASLFAEHTPQNMVINVDDEFGRALASRVASMGRLIVTGAIAVDGRPPGAERLILESVTPHARGLSLQIGGSWGPASIDSRLLGRFNASNLLGALAVLLLHDIELSQACQALARQPPPPGRMQQVAGDREGPIVIVDYAHTPDALSKALYALREHCTGELWCVFGCGGDRDAGKRPQMAAAADSIADQLVMTDDNPRTEDPTQIIADMMRGLKRHQAQVIHDRREAIAYALAAAQPGDIVLIAGKGHESYQLRGSERLPFSDSAVVSEILEGRA